MSSRTALLLALAALTGCPRDINHHEVRIAVTSIVTAGSNGVSTSPSVTPDGRYVAFASSSTNLTPAGSGGHKQVYRRNLQTGETILISVDPLGLPGDGDSDAPSISGDGLRIAFHSSATTFSADASPFSSDIYVRDLGVDPPVTIHASGAAGGGPQDSFVGCFAPSLSPDGAFVAFITDATNLISPNLPIGGLSHAYRVPLAGGATELVDVQSDGTPSSSGAMLGVSLSAAGRFVAFDSDATDLGAPPTPDIISQVYVRDMTLTTNAVILVSPSLDPSVLAFPMGSSGPSISADGLLVAFQSTVPNLVADDANGTVQDAFVRDLSDPLNPRTLLVSRRSDGTVGNSISASVRMAPDGRSVAYLSQSTNLVDLDFNGKADAFWHDLASGKTVRVSVDTAQREAQGDTGVGLSLTGDGRTIFFSSQASNLVGGDTNGLDDVFMRGPLY